MQDKKCYTVRPIQIRGWGVDHCNSHPEFYLMIIRGMDFSLGRICLIWETKEWEQSKHSDWNAFAVQTRTQICPAMLTMKSHL